MIPLLILLSISSIAEAQQTMCRNLGQEYGVGTSICECPSLIGDGRTGSGGRTRIISRRLICDRSGEWRPVENSCVDIVSSGHVAAEDFPKFHEMYCPRLAAMSVEQTEKMFESAPSIQVLAALRAICRRFPAVATQCQALIDNLAAGGR
jgi:hypothetical protein